MSQNAPTVSIERIALTTDPPHDVFAVKLEKGEGEWNHIAASESDLMLFLEGLRSGVAMMGGFLEQPEIPRNATTNMRQYLDRLLPDDYPEPK